MPLFYFVLKCGVEKVADEDGIELPDRKAARAHAIDVARELMLHRELSTRPWRLQVCDDYLNPCFEILFAEVDQSMAHLAPKYREAIELICRKRASLDDAFCEVYTSLTQVKETLARAGDLAAIARREMDL